MTKEGVVLSTTATAIRESSFDGGLVSVELTLGGESFDEMVGRHNSPVVLVGNFADVLIDLVSGLHRRCLVELTSQMSESRDDQIEPAEPTWRYMPFKVGGMDLDIEVMLGICIEDDLDHMLLIAHLTDQILAYGKKMVTTIADLRTRQLAEKNGMTVVVIGVGPNSSGLVGGLSLDHIPLEDRLEEEMLDDESLAGLFGGPFGPPKPADMSWRERFGDSRN